jgi:hypothetical protein
MHHCSPIHAHGNSAWPPHQPPPSPAAIHTQLSNCRCHAPAGAGGLQHPKRPHQRCIQRRICGHARRGGCDGCCCERWAACCRSSALAAKWQNDSDQQTAVAQHQVWGVVWRSQQPFISIDCKLATTPSLLREGVYPELLEAGFLERHQRLSISELQSGGWPPGQLGGRASSPQAVRVCEFRGQAGSCPFKMVHDLQLQGCAGALQAATACACRLLPP